ncbi:uncharacterized protein BYT42DRAFT_546360 [Radiomyces spectabilis]|uniref:uncharacterized protein n=1 Tax=Radiomyces spectabilis TaxID=64574 RepID=UPI00221F27CD|nr:uncharacterized protein BYT42DRAFT_546360 [Radiomyces spectabilis]KAI8377711.1 hypothetical protein BYT42DRAFT_546360 [Radiomyces spectabilis]
MGVAHPFFQGENTSDTVRTSLDLFQNPKNHPDAVGTILTYSGSRTGYTPASLSQAETASKFMDYISDVSRFPGFLLEHSSRERFELNEVNINLIANRIKEAYEGYLKIDINQVISSIQGLVNAVMSESQQNAYKSLFDQSPVVNVDGTLVIFINYVTLNMTKTQSGKTTVKTQTYEMQFARFSLNRGFIIANAQKLADALGDGGLDNWLNQGTSPQKKGVKTCFSNN